MTTGLIKVRLRGGFVVELYCFQSKEYLLLVETTDGMNNFATIGTITSFYCALRLDPQTLLVDVGDMTFASHSGTEFRQWGSFIKAPFAFAGDCRNGTVVSNINLRGTPFKVAESQMWFSGGNTVPNNENFALARDGAERQVFDIRGGGVAPDCGWMTPGRATFLANRTTVMPLGNDAACLLQWQLQLKVRITGAPLPPPVADCPMPNGWIGTPSGCGSNRVSERPSADQCPRVATVQTSMPSTTRPPTTTPVATTLSTSQSTTITSASTIVQASVVATVGTASEPGPNTDTVIAVGASLGAVVVILAVALGVVAFKCRSRTRTAAKSSEAPSQSRDNNEYGSGNIYAIPQDNNNNVNVSSISSSNTYASGNLDNEFKSFR
jgi:hypothetical protein